MLLEYRNKGSQWEAGLLRRRQAERALFLDGNCDLSFASRGEEVVASSNSVGAVNQKVKELQNICCEYGNNIEVDGIWGPKTEEAVHKLPLCGLPYTTPSITK